MTRPSLFRKKVHFVGIKGAGMAALAEIFVKNDARVTGTDTDEVFFTDKVLKGIGIHPHVGFSPKNVPEDADLVIYSTAYDKETNPELAAAIGRGIPTMSYPEAVGEFTRERMSLLVAGTHGKTTVSALLADSLRLAGIHPSAIVGGRVLSWAGNALADDGKYFVLEADEYQNKLRYYHPFGAILTSIDWDHPDFFPTFEEYKDAFREFVARIPKHGVLVYCNDDADVVEIAKEAKCEKRSYGFHASSDFRIDSYRPIPDSDPSAEKQSFEIVVSGKSVGAFELQLAGKHNAQNAAAVIALLSFLRINPESIREALKRFLGTERRFEYVGKRNEAIVYDDYAHHPEELKATIAAFKELYPSRKLTAVFHPHTFSRTKALLREFSQSFDEADRVVVLDIYGSAREKGGEVSSADLVSEINRYTPGKAENIHSINETVEAIRDTIGENDVVVTFGAGDVWKVAKKLAG